ncbi:MAG TPA: tRNA uridine-5-carboxymethylaminomethyl(34) synthesis enzyme MnmG, partial [Gemmatimonadales bacterium]|nr:tRNA uridine-5-carboxymethylaminomethyl(34) synthesis enzyme MnmG [Gemmatimonadales bacterium]
QMSCNPAIGGIAKGTVVREVDALGGVMGRAADRATIQFRMLNRSKGPAVWSPRAQCDRALYRAAVRALLESRHGLELREGTVGGFLFRGGTVAGVTTLDGSVVEARAVVLTAGTFLRGQIHLGTTTRIAAGRAGDAASVELAQVLEHQGLMVGRFKTGTPPRLDGRTVAYERTDRQDGDPRPGRFSHFESGAAPGRVPCWLTWTTAETREIIERHLAQSALYGGAISGRGPRYCPSVEDKVVKFPAAERHQVFLEPEGLDTDEVYVNGLSTSLPPPIQEAFLRTIPGLEGARMTRPGYAIEYDYFPPTQLTAGLEVRAIPGLFLAGQVNGTTGYEEAAGQGVLAGLNAAAAALGAEPVRLGRDEGLIGVLADDLVTRGVDEPYRLFTSRAEYRLLLRQDNALRRLLPLAERLELLTEEERRMAHERLEREDRTLELARASAITPEEANPVLADLGSAQIAEPVRVSELARRPTVPLEPLLAAAGLEGDTEWADVELKYGGYLVRERERAGRLARMDGFRLPEGLDYPALRSLSWEAREKLAAQQPATLGQAGRIPGVSPADLQALVMEVLKRR